MKKRTAWDLNVCVSAWALEARYYFSYSHLATEELSKGAQRGAWATHKISKGISKISFKGETQGPERNDDLASSSTRKMGLSRTVGGSVATICTRKIAFSSSSLSNPWRSPARTEHLPYWIWYYLLLSGQLFWVQDWNASARLGCTKSLETSLWYSGDVSPKSFLNLLCGTQGFPPPIDFWTFFVILKKTSYMCTQFPFPVYF